MKSCWYPISKLTLVGSVLRDMAPVAADSYIHTRLTLITVSESVTF